MRFEITLQLTKNERENILPLNYQYELSSWIYKVLNEGDPVFSKWLHTNGYKSGDKPFKLFTFSRLFIEKYNIKGDRLAILSSKVKLILSFLPEEIITPFIIGLFNERHFTLGDSLTKVAFNVTAVEALKAVNFNNEMKFTTISPLYVDLLEQGAKNKRHLSPESENYSMIISSNLKEKYRAYLGKDPNPSWGEVEITSLNTPKPKTITIKSGTPQETQIKGYEYRFTASGSPELLQIGYYGGFGGLNSQGFGCVELI